MDHIEGRVMEGERRTNVIANEVATVRETVRIMQNNFDELKKGLHEIQASVNQGNMSNQRMEATLKYSIDAQIDAKLNPLNTEIAKLKEAALVRKTQLAMIIGFGVFAGQMVIMILKALGVPL